MYIGLVVGRFDYQVRTAAIVDSLVVWMLTVEFFGMGQNTHRFSTQVVCTQFTS